MDSGSKARLAGKVALVTGAAGGFGEAIAERFAQEGATVVVADVQAQAGEQVAARLGAASGLALFVPCDISQEASVGAMVERVLQAFGRLDIVVNNAGVVHPNAPALEVPPEQFDRVFGINVKGLYWMARATLPHLVASQGCMVNLASATATRPVTGLAWYAASKAAVINITKGLALEFAPSGVRVNCICPSIGETPMMVQSMGGEVTPEVVARFKARLPLGRFATAQDVANAALCLAEPSASYLTGVSLDVDGGRNI